MELSPYTDGIFIDAFSLQKLCDFCLSSDVNVEIPDEKSMITYVVTYYHYFSRMKAESVQGKRIGRVSKLCKQCFIFLE